MVDHVIAFDIVYGNLEERHKRAVEVMWKQSGAWAAWISQAKIYIHIYITHYYVCMYEQDVSWIYYMFTSTISESHIWIVNIFAWHACAHTASAHEVRWGKWIETCNVTVHLKSVVAFLTIIFSLLRIHSPSVQTRCFSAMHVSVTMTVSIAEAPMFFKEYKN